MPSEGTLAIRQDPWVQEITALASHVIKKWGMGRNNCTLWALHEAVDAGAVDFQLEQARKGAECRPGEKTTDDPIWTLKPGQARKESPSTSPSESTEPSS